MSDSMNLKFLPMSVEDFCKTNEIKNSLAEIIKEYDKYLSANEENHHYNGGSRDEWYDQSMKETIEGWYK